MKIIEFKDVSVRYRLSRSRPKTLQELILGAIKRKDYAADDEDFWALRGITLSIERSQNTGILGQNGAGKSTLLKVIAGVIEPSGGKVIINGKVAPLIELGAGFDMELTGEENIFLNGSILGLSNREIKKRLDSIIDFSGLRDFIYAPIRTYSSGMISRLAFSIAISIDADILIVDEVLSVGDEAFRMKCKDRINEAIKHGTTLIFVSHNTRDVINLCERAILLQQGRVVSDGDTEIVSRHYLFGHNKRVFEDVEEGYENKQYIDKLFLSGIANGEVLNGKRYFMPDRQVTRAELILFLARIMGMKRDYKGEVLFEDVRENYVVYSHAAWLYEKGIIEPVRSEKGGLFLKPHDYITLGELKQTLKKIDPYKALTVIDEVDETKTITRGELSKILVEFMDIENHTLGDK